MHFKLLKAKKVIKAKQALKKLKLKAHHANFNVGVSSNGNLSFGLKNTKFIMKKGLKLKKGLKIKESLIKQSTITKKELVRNSCDKYFSDLQKPSSLSNKDIIITEHNFSKGNAMFPVPSKAVVKSVKATVKTAAKSVKASAKEITLDCVIDGVSETFAEPYTYIEAYGSARVCGATASAATVNPIVGGGAGVGCGALSVGKNMVKNIHHECFTAKSIAKNAIKNAIHKVI